MSTIALNKGYLNPDSSIDYWYSTSTWCYFRYLFVDVKHTWLLSYLAVAGVIVWIKQEFKERLIDNETTYVVIWGVGLICLFSFAIIHTNSLILIPKETQYMTMFLAPFSLLAGFSLSKLKGAFLCVVFSILIFGSFVLCGLEQQAVHVFTSNSKAALVFAQNNNEYPVYGTYHAVRASNYMSFFQNDAPR
ncbi:MAG: hypothetical protein U9R21_08010, partial [Candidatus Thermoplasmatota archaeon]|nr:hypothetical protein [Candidatus Thermoplasmatota archaeon]